MEEKKTSKTETEKKATKTVKRAATKSETKTAAKSTAKTATKTATKKVVKKPTTRTTKKKDIEEIEELEDLDIEYEEDEDIRQQIKNRRKVDEKSFNTGISLGAKVAIVVVIAVILILLLLKGCKSKGEYTIKFNTNGGTHISEQVISANGKVSVPKDPTKEGYTFVGWYLDGKRFDFDSKINSDLVIEAKWETEGSSEVTGITIDQKEVVMLPGDSIPLIATVEPSDAKNKKVKWTSSDETYVVVNDEGVITAKSKGSATITVTTDEKGFTATCKVAVSDDVVKVKSITLSQNNVTLTIDDTKRIDATIEPANATNKGITWTSKDNNIATVSSSGVIRGRAEGETTIVATTKDGKFTQEVKVKVEKVTVKELKVEDLTLGVGESKTLVYKVLPTNATEKEVSWKVEDTSCVTIDKNGKVTANKEECTTKVIGTTKEGEKKGNATIKVTKPVAVTGVSLDKTDVTIEVGQSVTINATVTPKNAANKTIRWNNADNSVASIKSNGTKLTITGKAEGTTSVHVITYDGNQTKECVVTVIPKKVVKTYTYSVRKEQEDEQAPAYYYITVFENGVDVTSQVSKFAGKATKNKTPIVFSDADAGRLTSSVEIIVSGDTLTATKK